MNQLSTTGQKALKTMRNRLCFTKKGQKLRFDFYFYWNLFPQDFYQIRRVIERVHYLQDFNFKTSTKQQITDENLFQLCEGLKRCVFLTKLSFYFGHCEDDILTDYGCQHLSKCIKRLVLLQNLSLSIPLSNNMTDAGIRGIGKALKRLIYLQNISFDFYWSCKITSKGVEFILECTKRHPFLKGISINFDACDGFGKETMIKMIEEYPLFILVSNCDLKLNYGVSFGNRMIDSSRNY